MEVFARCGADLLLSGHLHTSHAGRTAQRYAIAGYAALVVQAGTATSTRGRGEDQLVQRAAHRRRRDRRRALGLADEEPQQFALAASQRFAWGSGGWQAAG